MGYRVKNLQVPGREGDILQEPSRDTVYTAWTGAGGCQQHQILEGGYLKQPQLEHSRGQNHSQRKQVTRIY